MRERAVSFSEGPNATKVIFEGLVETQEYEMGSIGPPANAMSMTTSGAYRKAVVRILRAYRGITSKQVLVLTGMGAGDCGFDFRTGKQYLIYADRIDGDDVFTSICSGTSPVEQAGPALRFLRGEPPSADDLTDVEAFYKKFYPQWTGTACGRVTKTNGAPLSKAGIEMTEVREDSFPPMVADDPDLSNLDGSFCIPDIPPGKYLLTAETTDFDGSFRWMGYYPGATTHAKALPVEVRAGEKLSNLLFTASKQRLYTVAFRIVALDGTPLPLDELGVAIDSPDRDGLAYHLTQNRNESGVYFAGYVPPGHYFVQTYTKPDFETGAIRTNLAKWRMAKDEVDIPSSSEIVLKLVPLH